MVVITGLPSASVTSVRSVLMTAPNDSTTDSSQESKYSLSPAQIGRWYSDLLVAVDDPGQVDADVEVAEDVQLHLTARDGDERQRRDDVGIAGGPGRLLIE